MNEKTVVLTVLALVVVTATVGLFYSSDTSGSDQATGLQISRGIGIQSYGSQTQTRYNQYGQKTATTTKSYTTPSQQSQAKAISCEGKCRIWQSNACGGFSELFVVNGQGKWCVSDVYKMSPYGQSYVTYPNCGKTSTGQLCNNPSIGLAPFSNRRNECVCP